MELTWAESEMAGAKVWDRRCRRSLGRICAALAERPLTSFSAACGPAVRQAAHRIFAHQHTSVGGLLQGHFAQTQQRALRRDRADPNERLLVVQDTTTVDYSSHFATADLGPVGNELHQRGLLAHAALALPAAGAPLGLLHLDLWTRNPEVHGQCRDGNVARGRPAEEKESRKWLDGLRGVEAALGPDLPFLLIQDREGDVFDFLHAPRQANAELLIRAASPRLVLLAAPPPGMSVHRQRREAQTLWEALEEAPTCGTMTVKIPRAPGRKAREAQLTLSTLQVWLLPPRERHVTELGRLRRPVAVWVVWAREAMPPPDAPATPVTPSATPVTPPVSWVLLCTLPVAGAEAAAQLVRCYARRWLIEQLHLVLKSGLRIERLQFDDATSLKHAIALCYVVAWRVLYTRDLARFVPDAPAEEVISPVERQILEAVERQPLSTARSVVRAVAHLAGFPRYPSAGEPGVKSLWEGFRRLEGAVLGWELAHEQLRDMRQD